MDRRHSRLLTGLALAVVLAGVWTTPARAQPPLPAGFYGTVVDLGIGGPVPNGTPIVATVPHPVTGLPPLVVGQTSTFVFGGSSVYSLDVAGDNPDVPGKDGASPGDQITFKIFGVAASQTGTWTGGTSVRLDLARPPVGAPPGGPVATPLPGPTPTPIPMPTVIPEAQVTPMPRKDGDFAIIVQPTQQVKLELDDKTVITVPPLAMPITTQMKARSVTEGDLPQAPKGQLRKAIEIDLFDDKGGKIEFIEIRRPIIIEVPLTRDDLAAMGSDPNNMELRRFDEGSRTWVKLNAEVDLIRNVIRGRLTHLSLFAVVIPAPVAQVQPTPTAAPPSAGGEVPGSPAWLLALAAGLGVLLFGFHLLKRGIETARIP